MAKEDKFADEMLTDDELDVVSGGTLANVANDSRFLNVLLAGREGQCDRYGEWRVFQEDHGDEIVKAWASVGIEAKMNRDTLGNTYKRMDNGESLTQEEARQYAMNVVGKQLKQSDWKW